MHSSLLAILVLCALLHAPGAGAEERPLWELGAGAFPMWLPDYRGSDQSRGYVYPFPYVRYRGEVLKMDDRHGLAALLLLDSERFEFDVSANASQPAPSDKNIARQGMPDLQPTVEFGPQLKVKLWENSVRTNELSLQIPVRAAFAIDGLKPEYIGVVFNPVIDFFMRNAGPGGGWRFGMQAGPLFADRRYNAYYYQVDPQYATPDRPAYSAPGGYSGTQITFSLNKRFNRIWVGGFLRAFDLHGAVYDASPLVKTRSALLAGIGIAYVFGQSATMVESDD